MSRSVNYLTVFVTIVAVCTLTIWFKSSTNPDIYTEKRADGEHAISVMSPLTSKQTGQPRYKAKHVRKGCRPNMTHAIYYSQSREDYALFKNYFNSPPICGGVYVEIGALDGVRHSNTKFFQDQLNWTGVLIEAQPDNARQLAKNRPASQNTIFAEAVCAEPQTHVNFTGKVAVGGIPSLMTPQHIKHFYKGVLPRTIQVPCRPMGTMLRKADISAVDVFVVDVEGAELMVLETMDWTIPVKVFIVEMGHGERDQQVKDLLSSQGYHTAIWNTAGFCEPGKSCTKNQVFEHQNYVY